MMKYSSIPRMLGLLILCWACHGIVYGQGRYPLGSGLPPVNLSEDLFTLEGDALLNPIYISQISSGYRLNKTVLPISPRPRFYALQTGQNAFLSSTPFAILTDISTIGDQANAGYASIPLWFWDHTKNPLFHDLRFKVGITHDKMQTNAPNVTYGYGDGGTELTFLLEKRIFKSLSDLDLQSVNLWFNVTVQAGVLFPLAAVKPVVVENADTIIRPLSDHRWQPLNFKNGWGWQTGLKIDIGGQLCHEYFLSRRLTQDCWLAQGLFRFFRRLGITVGTRLVLEELYSKPQVLYYGQSGYRLNVNNFCFFFSGPVISFRWLKLQR